MNPTAVRTKVDAVLRKLTPVTEYTVSTRTVTVSGDTLTGRVTTTSSPDTLLNPQPGVNQVKEKLVLSDGFVTDVGDFSFVISANSMTLDELLSPNTRLVLKKPNGSEIVLRVEHYKAPTLQGVAVAFTAVGRQSTRA